MMGGQIAHSGEVPSPVGDDVAATEGRAAGKGWEVLGLNIIKAGVVA